MNEPQSAREKSIKHGFEIQAESLKARRSPASCSRPGGGAEVKEMEA